MGTGVLQPFWSYYGGKWRLAPRYPPPRHSSIVEPFAGAAGYAMRYPDLDVTLVDSYPNVTELWRYLIGASEREIRAIPLVEDVGDLSDTLPTGARLLVAWNMNSAAASPRRTLSSGNRKLQKMGRRFAGWTDARRERTASQLHRIRHWSVIEGDYTAAPRDAATFFVDPPYQGRPGTYYPRRITDYDNLGEWCRNLPGQAIVCEAVGSTWLPFKPFAASKAGPARGVSHEAVWLG